MTEPAVTWSIRELDGGFRVFLFANGEEMGEATSQGKPFGKVNSIGPGKTADELWVRKQDTNYRKLTICYLIIMD